MSNQFCPLGKKVCDNCGYCDGLDYEDYGSNKKLEDKIKKYADYTLYKK